VLIYTVMLLLYKETVHNRGRMTSLTGCLSHHTQMCMCVASSRNLPLKAHIWHVLYKGSQFYLPPNTSHTCLYSQPQSITVHWLVLISCPSEERRLSWPEYTVSYQLAQGCLQLDEGEYRTGNLCSMNLTLTTRPHSHYKCVRMAVDKQTVSNT